MKKIFTLFSTLVFSVLSYGQVTITGNNIPQPGDTVRHSISYNLNGMDYEAAGAGLIWDFTGLNPLAQQVDTFISPGETPDVLQFIFNNIFLQEYKATVVQRVTGFNLVPNFPITDAWDFYKKTDNDFRELGFGVNIMGAALPIPFQGIDTLYRYPMQYGNIDSAHSCFSIDVPNLGYLGGDRTRTNYCEGWGTLITPYGSFQTLKLRTVIHEYDSIYIDSLNMGLPITRDYTEYKWFSEDYGHPLCVITEEGAVISAVYMDSVREVLTGLPQVLAKSFSFNIYPNPATDNLSVSYELYGESEVEISLYSLYGLKIKSLFHGSQGRGLYNRIIYLGENGIKPGIYLLRLQVNNLPKVKRLVVN